MVIQIIYTPNFYIDIFGVSIETPTSGKIRLFAKNKEIIEPYNIENDVDNGIKILRTTTYFFNIFYFFNFIANNNIINEDGKVLKNSFNMKEDTGPILA